MRLRAFLKGLFSFHGRAPRAQFWLGQVVLLAGLLIALAGGYRITASFAPLFKLPLIILGLGGLWVLFALTVKRLHDRDRSGHWLWIFWIVPAVFPYVLNVFHMEGFPGLGLFIVTPVLNLWGYVEMGFLPGTSGRNSYGEDPLIYLSQNTAIESGKPDEGAMIQRKDPSGVSFMRYVGRCAIMILFTYPFAMLVTGAFRDKDSFMFMGALLVMFGSVPIIGGTALLQAVETKFREKGPFVVSLAGFIPLVYILSRVLNGIVSERVRVGRFYAGMLNIMPSSYLAVLVLACLAWSVMWIATSWIVRGPDRSAVMRG